MAGQVKGVMWCPGIGPVGPELRNGLAGYWKLDEGDGDKAHNSSGNGNHGTLTNGPLWEPRGLTFDGANDHVVLAPAPITDFTSPITVAVWIAWTDADAPVGNTRSFLNVGTGATAGFALTTGYQAAGQDKVGFVYNNGGNNNWAYNAGAGLNDGNMHHIVGVATAPEDTANFLIYVDGQSESFTHDGGLNVANGNMIADGPGSPFHGVMFQAAIWSRVLALSEIKQLDANPFALGASPRAF